MPITTVVTQKNVSTNAGCNHLQYIIEICNLDHKLLNIFYVGKNIDSYGYRAYTELQGIK